MFALRALLPWAALAAALALLFFAGRMLVDLREQLAATQDRAAVMESALGTATAEVARMVWPGRVTWPLASFLVSLMAASRSSIIVVGGLAGSRPTSV